MRYVFCLIWLALSTPALALELKLTDTFDLNRPASLDYDPTFCGLWIANEGPDAILVTLAGLELRRVTSDMNRIKAISIEGDNLIVGDGAGNFQRITKDGEALSPPFRISTGWADTEGIAVGLDGQLITVEDDPEYLTWLSKDGEVLRRIDTMTLSPPLSEAQGIAIDPRNGHLLIVDDREGTNSLYEFDGDGNLLATASLIEFGIDPEGIAIRPGSNQLFVAFDTGARVASFEYTPTSKAGDKELPIGADCMMM